MPFFQRFKDWWLSYPQDQIEKHATDANGRDPTLDHHHRHCTRSNTRRRPRTKERTADCPKVFEPAEVDNLNRLFESLRRKDNDISINSSLEELGAIFEALKQEKVDQVRPEAAHRRLCNCIHCLFAIRLRVHHELTSADLSDAQPGPLSTDQVVHCLNLAEDVPFLSSAFQTEIRRHRTDVENLQSPAVVSWGERLVQVKSDLRNADAGLEPFVTFLREVKAEEDSIVSRQFWCSVYLLVDYVVPAYHLFTYEEIRHCCELALTLKALSGYAATPVRWVLGHSEDEYLGYIPKCKYVSRALHCLKEQKRDVEPLLRIMALYIQHDLYCTNYSREDTMVSSSQGDSSHSVPSQEAPPRASIARNTTSNTSIAESMDSQESMKDFPSEGSRVRHKRCRNRLYEGVRYVITNRRAFDNGEVKMVMEKANQLKGIFADKQCSHVISWISHKEH